MRLTIRQHVAACGLAATVALAGCTPANVNPTQAAGSTASPQSSTSTGAGPGQVTSVVTFPDLSIVTLQNGRLPGSVANDRQLLVGGVGSDLWRAPTNPPNEIWMITDRGPNGKLRNGGKNRRTFPIPEYTPMILHVRVENGTAELVETIPIRGQSGQPVTGLPNLAGHDETGYDFRAQHELPFNPRGLDTEGLIRTPSGELWVVEEYGPSLVRVDAQGEVVKRFVPEGVTLTGADYPVSATLPAIYARRSSNRGFEGLTASPDGKTLYLAIQSPLANPNKKADNRSRNTRILAFDTASEKVVGGYVYRFEPIAEFDPTAKPAPEEMKLSALAYVDANRLLVLERTDRAARIYLADLSTATNILGTTWDDPAANPSLEALDDPAAAGITPLAKALAVDLTMLPNMPDKIEGIAILDRSTLMVANDNDFDIGLFDVHGNNVGQGLKSQLLTIGLAQPLP